MARILLLEDDDIAAFNYKRRLEIDGHKVDWFTDGLDAVKACDEGPYNLLILDVQLHNSAIDGIETASFIREKHYIPLFFITASQSEDTSVRGYQEGAITFIRKPFTPKILSYQVRNILDTSFCNKIISHKGFTLDMRRHIVFTENGEEIHLSETPLHCFAYLIKNKGRVVTKDELSENVWMGEIPVSDEVIHSTIQRIRKSLGKNAIQTRRGIGYEVEA